MPSITLRKQPFFYVLVIVVVLLSLFVLRPYISAVVLAFLTALFFRPVYEYFHHAFKGRAKLASSMAVVVVIVAVVIPLSMVIVATVNQAVQFNNDLSGQGNLDLEGAVTMANDLIDSFGVDYDLQLADVQAELKTIASSVGQFFLQQLPKIGSGAINFFASAFIYIVVLFSLFPVQKNFSKFVERLSPLDDRIDSVYISRVVAMSKSMVKGTFLIAFVQALVGSLILVIAGVDYILFWMILMLFVGIIPMIGVSIVLLPISIILLITGSVWQGIFVLLASQIIVANIDNIMRPKLVSKKASLHPALVLIGVLGGIQVFGALGFIYGPVIMILLVTTFEMYHKYFQHSSNKIKK